MQETYSEVETEVIVEDTSVSGSSPFTALLDRISAWLIGAVLLVTPLVVSFRGIIPTPFAKHVFFVVLVSLSLIAWVVARIISGRMRIAKSSILLSLLVLLLLLLPATLFSNSFSLSLLGVGSESGSFISILMYVVTAFLVSVHAKSPRYVVGYLAYLLGFSIFVFLGHVANVFSGPFQLFNSGSFIGKWNDLGLFYGLALVIALFFVNVVGVSGRYRFLAYVSATTSLVGLIIVNFPNAWYLAVFFSIVVIISAVRRRSRLAEQGEVSSMTALILPIIVLLVAITFSLLGGINGYLGEKITSFQLSHNVSSLEARPSWQATIGVAKESLKKDPFFGAGLNRFSSRWVMYRQASIAETAFWNIDFNAGIGYVPTFAVTAGIVGFLGWLLFLAVTWIVGFRYTFSQGTHHEAQVALLTLFAGLSYLLFVMFFYVSDSFLIGLAFIFVGLFVATSRITGQIRELSLNLYADARIRFVSLLFLVVLVVVAGFVGIASTRRVMAFSSFQKGLVALNAGAGIDEVRSYLEGAIQRAPLDIYQRAMSEAETLRVQQLLASEATDPAALRAEFQDRLSRAVTAAEAAIEYDRENYLNFLALGRVYASLSALPFEDSYGLAKTSFEFAQERAPRHPLIALELARLERTEGNQEAARTYFKEALARKPNYSQALFEFSLLEIESENLSAALERTEQAAILSPNNEGLFFQLGFLRYQNKDYEQAGVALEHAVSLDDSYANALYLLGLVYDELGYNKEAIISFERVLQFNSDNEHIRQALENVRAGRPALAGLDSPIETGILPIDEE
ncbi:MAG: hypothetical protein Q8Q18_01785 [bacterium]|nr:hypothetical protein [bacterium]